MIISINSISGPPGGQLWCDKKQKSSRNLNLLDFCATFKSKLNKLRKTTKNEEKTFKNDGFGAVFRSLFNFDLKVAHKFNKFKFLELFCFFWHPWWPWGCPDRGDMTCFTFLFEIFWWWRHLHFFQFIENQDLVTFVGLNVEVMHFYTFYVQFNDFLKVGKL